ncbi:MAG: hypothetical protein ACFE95_00185 [Candidatus Hodarchaeota archaeon]
MRKSRQTVTLTMISIFPVIISFFFTSQLDSFSTTFVYVFGIIFISFALLAAFLAYKERTAPGWDPLIGPFPPSSTRTFCLIGASILITILIMLFTPVGEIWGIEDVPASIENCIIVIGLWIASCLLIIIAALVYEDLMTKSWI